MPSRNAILLIALGFRPITCAASSNDFEVRASSIKRRCSENDQFDKARTLLPNSLPRDFVLMGREQAPADGASARRQSL
jgi:hypothetical protein